MLLAFNIRATILINYISIYYYFSLYNHSQKLSENFSENIIFHRKKPVTKIMVMENNSGHIIHKIIIIHPDIYIGNIYQGNIHKMKIFLETDIFIPIINWLIKYG